MRMCARHNDACCIDASRSYGASLQWHDIAAAPGWQALFDAVAEASFAALDASTPSRVVLALQIFNCMAKLQETAHAVLHIARGGTLLVSAAWCVEPPSSKCRMQ